MSRMKISRNGLYLIESFEGFRAKAVILPDGRYTIGFGHAATAREGMIINREQAEQLLLWDLIPVEEAVRNLVHAPINQNQFDALVSFVFNISIAKFKQSEILKHLNQGQLVSAALAMNLWRRSMIGGRSIVVDALIRRRAHEIAIFLEPIGTRPAAPSPVVVPLLDAAVAAYEPDPEQVREIKPIPHSAAFEITEQPLKNVVNSTDNSTKEFATDANMGLLANHESENHLKILDETSYDTPPEAANAIAKAELKTEKAANDTNNVVKTNNDSVVSEPVEKLVQKPEKITPAKAKTTTKTTTKTTNSDIANYFMMGAGAIALIASISELLKYGVFAGNTALTPNIAFIEMVAAVGFIAIIIGALSKFKS